MSSRLAVVTGCSSGIGAACCGQLLQAGWTVYGISRRPAAKLSAHFSCDLSVSSELEQTANRILDLQKSSNIPSLNLLINCAGIGYFAQHHDLSTDQIVRMVQINLTAPLLLTKLLLNSIKAARGTIINVSSFSAYENSSFGATYGSTKAALTHFSRSLFEEVRRSGVKVVSIAPDITRTPFYEGAPFSPEDTEEAFITPECIAHTVFSILNQRPETVTTEIILRPQRVLLKKHPRQK